VSVKSRIMTRCRELVDPLQAEGKVRVIERTSALGLLAAVRPALHLVDGDEDQIGEDERGYTLQFPIAFEVIFEELRDPHGTADELLAWIQEKIESDLQLSGLANAITYVGGQKFIMENVEPKQGHSTALYNVEYRRERKKPDVSY